MVLARCNRTIPPTIVISTRLRLPLPVFVFGSSFFFRWTGSYHLTAVLLGLKNYRTFKWSGCAFQFCCFFFCVGLDLDFSLAPLFSVRSIGRSAGRSVVRSLLIRSQPFASNGHIFRSLQMVFGKRIFSCRFR